MSGGGGGAAPEPPVRLGLKILKTDFYNTLVVNCKCKTENKRKDLVIEIVFSYTLISVLKAPTSIIKRFKIIHFPKITFLFFLR